MSPCAYLAGLLHPLVVEELELPRRGFAWTPAVNGLFVPFLDGSSIQLWDDDERCAAEVRALAPGDVEGLRAMCDVIRRLRDALRPARAAGDLWIGDPPTREQIEDRLGDDAEARSVLFDWSMAEFVEHYLRDERLQIAYLGQGVIGTNASPFDPGTASIRFHHASGRLGGMPGMWGYVRGGMGMVSFYFCDAAREAGATVISGVPVAQILPGEGVLLEGGERIAAPHRRLQRRSAPDPPPSRHRSRPRMARPSRTRSHRRLHRQAQRAPARAAQLHRPPRHRPAPPLRPDQRPSHKRRVEIRPTPPPAAASSQTISGANFTSKARTIPPSSRRVSTP